MNQYMDFAYQAGLKGMAEGKGGPFGATIVKDGQVIAVACNHVLSEQDPTAHAEMMAIRLACKNLGTYDLTGCEIYATGEPCPMCLSAIIWANIKTCYFSNSAQEAEAIGFRDDLIYRQLRNEEQVVSVIRMDAGDCHTLYDIYAEEQKTIY